MNANTMHPDNRLAQQQHQGIEQVRERPSVAPRVDVYETKDAIVLVADMPGVSQENLKIDVADDRLTLQGTRTPGIQGNGGRQRELVPFDYVRVFTLPDGVDRDKITAQLKLGVLTLELPKSAAIKPRRIQIKG
jgi:HSP20 family molecular chaperone IbpA